MRRFHCVALCLVAALAAGCLDADLTLRPDGSVAGTLTWATTKPLTEAAARTLVTADGVTIKSVSITPPDTTKKGTESVAKATAIVEAKSVEALAGTPLLKAMRVTASLGKPADGKRLLTVRAARADGEETKSVATDNVIHLHLPGAVSETSATAKGNDVTWTVTHADWKSRPTVDLKVAFAVTP